MVGNIESVHFHLKLNSVVNTLNSLQVYSSCYYYGDKYKYKAKIL